MDGDGSVDEGRDASCQAGIEGRPLSKDPGVDDPEAVEDPTPKGRDPL